MVHWKINFMELINTKHYKCTGVRISFNKFIIYDKENE